MTKTVLLFLLLCPLTLWAQFYKITPEDTGRDRSFLYLRDGSVVKGRILRQDSTVITVRERGDERTFIEADQVLRVTGRDDRPQFMPVSPGPASPYSVFVLRDSSRVRGQIIKRDSIMYTVRQPGGKLTYFEPELLVRTETDSPTTAVDATMQNGRSAFVNRFSPFLLTGVTAFNPEKGRLYYRNIYLLYNELDLGITRNWSAGLSVTPFYAQFNDAVNSPRQSVLGANVRLFSKLTFAIGPQFRFGANVTYQPKQTNDIFSASSQWTLQGLMSFGDSQRNVTLGFSRRLYPDAVFASNLSFISIGVGHKLSRNLTFVSDNSFYLNPFAGGTSANLSAALRFDRRRHAFDAGALAAIYPSYFSIRTQARFAPYIGYNLLIGQ